VNVYKTTKRLWGLFPPGHAGFIFDMRSADASVDNSVIRRSGGDKPRRYIYAKSFDLLISCNQYARSGIVQVIPCKAQGGR
jgi:hypothetical protein